MGIATTDDHDTQTIRGTDLSTEASSGTTRAPSMRVVTAVARATDRDPTAMAPLYEAIDTDALDRVLEADAVVEVVFEYQGHAVEVTGDGRVSVDGDQYVVG